MVVPGMIFGIHPYTILKVVDSVSDNQRLLALVDSNPRLLVLAIAGLTFFPSQPSTNPEHVPMRDLNGETTIKFGSFPRAQNLPPNDAPANQTDMATDIPTLRGKLLCRQERRAKH